MLNPGLEHAHEVHMRIPTYYYMHCMHIPQLGYVYICIIINFHMSEKANKFVSIIISKCYLL